MTKTITVSEIIPAAAADIYAAWLDGVAHAAMTGGGKADASPEIGARYSAWDGYIKGLNLALNPGERIEQSWRSTDFTPGDPDSTLTVLFEPADGGTRVTLIHSGVPDQMADFADGWRQYYFDPMKSYFAALMAPPEVAAPAPMPEPAAAMPMAAEPPARKPAPRKTVASKKPASAKKAAAKKPAAKKPAARKPAAKTTTARKTAAKKPAAKKRAAATRKTATSKKPAPARKLAAKKPAARKAATRRPAAKKKPPGRKVAAQKIAKKSMSKKPAARKSAAKKPARRGRR